MRRQMRYGLGVVAPVYDTQTGWDACVRSTGCTTCCGDPPSVRYAQGGKSVVVDALTQPWVGAVVGVGLLLACLWLLRKG